MKYVSCLKMFYFVNCKLSFTKSCWFVLHLFLVWCLSWNIQEIQISAYPIKSFVLGIEWVTFYPITCRKLFGIFVQSVSICSTHYCRVTVTPQWTAKVTNLTKQCPIQRPFEIRTFKVNCLYQLFFYLYNYEY